MLSCALLLLAPGVGGVGGVGAGEPSPREIAGRVRLVSGQRPPAGTFVTARRPAAEWPVLGDPPRRPGGTAWASSRHHFPPPGRLDDVDGPPFEVRQPVDASGAFRLAIPADATHVEVSVTGRGITGAREPVVCAAGDPDLAGGLVIEAMPVTPLEVRVEAGGAPVPGARVVAVPDAGTRSELLAELGERFALPWTARIATTDSAGTARFEDLLPGPVRLTAWAPEAGATRAGNARVDPRRTVVLSLSGGAEVSGVVVDPDGRPVRDADVGIGPTFPVEATMGIWGSPALEACGALVARTGADGAFRIRGVPGGCLILARARAWAPSRPREVSKEEMQGESAKVVLRRPSPVSGKVSDAQGRPAAGVPVSAHVGEDARIFCWTTTDADGSYAIADAPAGGGEVRAGWEPGVATSSIPASRRVDLRLEVPVVARGRVVDATTGEPVRRFSIEQTLSSRRFAASDGSFRIETTPAAWLSIRAEGRIAAEDLRFAAPWGDTVSVPEIRLERERTVRGRAVVGSTDVSFEGCQVLGVEGKESRAPFAHVRVADAWTGADGWFRVGVGPAIGSLRVLPAGGASVQYVLPAPDKTLLARVPPSVTLRAKTPEEGGKPVVGWVRAGSGRYDLMGPEAVPTGDDGAFVIDGLAPGEWRLTVADGPRGDDVLARGTVVIAEDGGAQVTWSPLGTRFVTVRVRRGGAPLAGARVKVVSVVPFDRGNWRERAREENEKRSGVTDAEGVARVGPFVSEHLQASLVSPAVPERPGMPDEELPPQPEGEPSGEPPPAPTSFDLEVPAGAVTGRVVRAGTRAPVPGIPVWVEDPSEEVILLHASLGSAITAPDGTFSILHLPPGEYRVTAAADPPPMRSGPDPAEEASLRELLPSSMAVAVAKGTAPPVEIALRAGAVVRVRVLDAAGTPVPGAIVTLVSETAAADDRLPFGPPLGDRHMDATEEDGRARFAGLLPDSVRAYASIDGWLAASDVLAVPEEGTVDAVVVLDPARLVEVRVRATLDGRRIVPTELSLRHRDQWVHATIERTPEGPAWVARVPEGPIRAHASGVPFAAGLEGPSGEIEATMDLTRSPADIDVPIDRR